MAHSEPNRTAGVSGRRDEEESILGGMPGRFQLQQADLVVNPADVLVEARGALHDVIRPKLLTAALYAGTSKLGDG